MGEAYFAFREIVRNEAVLVGITGVTVAEDRVGSNNERKSIIIRNNSPNATDIITVQLSTENQAITADAGIILRQFEAFTDSNDSGYKCFQGKITAICATATGKLAVMER